MNNNQITKEKLIDIRESLDDLLNYYLELKKTLQENLLIDNKIYKLDIYNNLYNDVNNLRVEVNELIRDLDYYD